MIRAIVLDIGGVLLRTEDRSTREELERKYELPPGSSDTLVFDSPVAKAATIGRVPTQAIWEDVAKKLDLTPDSLETFKQAFWAGDRVDHSLLEFLVHCRSDYTTALLSNAWLDARSTFAHNYGLVEGKTVDFILISAELGVAKPNPKIYHILAERVKRDFGEILFVDDFIENVIAADQLGIQTIHYQPGMSLSKKIKSRLK